MEEILLETKGIWKCFPMGANREVVVLEDISMTVRSGEFVSILGPSGAGKSTLLRILAGLSPPSKGDVLYWGAPLDSTRPRLGMVFQNFALFPWLSVKENVKLGLRSAGIPRVEAEEKAISVLDTVGLDGFEDAYPRELSGGMRQRVGIARALVVEPDLLLMDEPFSALDILTADNLRHEIAELWTRKKMPIKSIILVTHNIEEAVFLSDRAVILGHNPGRIRADFALDLPDRRDANSREFRWVVDRIYTILTRPTEDVDYTIRAGKYQFLPYVKIGAIAGLLEIVFNGGNRVDIFVLASDLGFEVDDIVPLMEASVALGLGRIDEGDFLLTERGGTFSQADTLEKKEIFRIAALENVQLIKQIAAVLEATPNHRMGEDFFLEILENHFTSKEAWSQLEIAIDWGRYGEIFAYDYDSGELYSEAEAGETPNQ
jgi:NitT/TauT family transport system ATP-binding protein